MGYLINDSEFDKIKNGELKKEEIININRKLLMSWTGEDIEFLMDKKITAEMNKQHKVGYVNISKEGLEKIVDIVIEYLICKSAKCVENSLDYALKKVENES